MDFTLRKYSQLLNAIKGAGYEFQTMEEFVTHPKIRSIVLRHDSDIWYWTDLNMANVEGKQGVRSTYYFRMPETFRENITQKIIQMKHEIGYHYEDLARTKGDYEKAIGNFRNNLTSLRRFYPVRTVARHGRPLSRWESLDLWKKVNLKDFDLIAEPYLSIDYTKVLYLTDNGSKWNADRSNIRDKVNSGFNYNIRTTDMLIDHFNKKLLPDQIILNIHPARWSDNYLIWMYRYFLQKAKNIAKYFLNLIRKNGQ